MPSLNDILSLVHHALGNMEYRGFGLDLNKIRQRIEFDLEANQRTIEICFHWGK